jgi:hypothetical protein
MARCSRLAASSLFIALAGATPTALGVSPSLIFSDAFEPVNYRFTSLYLRDPHVWVNFLGCHDVTDSALVGFSVNGQLQTNIQTDGNADGFYDLSYLQRLYPLDENDGAVGAANFVSANCSTTTGACAADGSLPLLSMYTSHTTGQCLGVIGGTTVHLYSPIVTEASAPCFATSPVNVTLNLGGIPVVLNNARIGATYSDPTHLTNGLLTGFISQTDANNTILPATLPLIGGMPLSALLPGGTGNCAAFSDKDTIGGVTGWQFYLNFDATRVNYND